MLFRHQLGGDRERRRNGKAETDAGEDADDDQLRAGLRERDQQGEKGADDDADLHHQFAADTIGHRGSDETADDDQEGRSNDEPADLRAGQLQRALGQQEMRAAERKVIALDEAHRAEHQNGHEVMGAEGDAIELAPRIWLAGMAALPSAAVPLMAFSRACCISHASVQRAWGLWTSAPY